MKAIMTKSVTSGGGQVGVFRCQCANSNNDNAFATPVTTKFVLIPAWRELEALKCNGECLHTHTRARAHTHTHTHTHTNTPLSPCSRCEKNTPPTVYRYCLLITGSALPLEPANENRSAKIFGVLALVLVPMPTPPPPPPPPPTLLFVVAVFLFFLFYYCFFEATLLPDSDHWLFLVCFIQAPFKNLFIQPSHGVME